MIRRTAFNAMELLCEVQTYDWGKLGFLSEVASLAQSNNSRFKIHDDVPYAEFWMGTHPNAPSKLKVTEESLKSWISKNSNSLGISKSKFGDELSFLFKVLSINKALSIQAHPAKVHAERLHLEKPTIYKDANHKPEMAIALTPFEMLAGFRSHDEIRMFFNDIPELKSLVNEENADKFINGNNSCALLKECFSVMMNQPDNVVGKAVGDLIERLGSSGEETKQLHLYSLVERLNSQFKNDIGIFGVYFFNYIRLQPGEAVYLGANFPHAYLSGDCVECMACSDNVVRAGLTPKLKDVDTLVAMLDYTGYKPSEILLKGQSLDDNNISFSPPIPDFSLNCIKVSSEQNYQPPIKESASIVLILKGEGKTEDGLELKRGTVIFLPAGIPIKLACSSNITAYQASSNDELLLA